MMEIDDYHKRGYYNRADYLRCMSEDYDVPLETVQKIADMLGKNEDFHGLLNALEDVRNEKVLAPRRQVDVYEAHGYHDRESFLQSLAQTYGVPLRYVEKFSAILGPPRDFNGLEDLLGLVADLIGERS